MIGGRAQAGPRAQEAAPDSGAGAEARYARAVALMEREDYEAALEELERLRDLAPDLPQAHYSLGYILRHTGRIGEALAAYRRALELRPGHADTYSNLLVTLNYSAEHSAAEIFEEHRRYGARHVQPCLAPAPDRGAPRRLRIGYLSPDFCAHVVSCFMLPVLRRHDRARFEVFCYHTRAWKDAVTEAMRALAEHWADCAGMTDAAIAERIRADRVDILVDLAGHMAYQRLGVLALRPAPVQATYLGYPNTTGLRAVDYRITDAVADPPGESDRLHVERLVRLPRAFLCYRPGPDLHAVGPPPVERSGRPTFGCFNNFQKLSEPFFDAAAGLLRAVPEARLLLKAKPLMFGSVRARVAARFSRAGVDPGRVELRGWAGSVEEHLAAYSGVDVALDSFPYNGATTTCEALWMGVPVVTLRGDRHAGRVGASLLRAVGLDDLVAGGAEQFVRIAASLARERPRLARLRAELRDRLRASPLMDERGFVAALEGAYEEMWREKAQAAPPRPDPARAATLLQEARALRAAGTPERAKQACAAALDRQPAAREALDLFWELCNETADHAAAVERIGAALAEERGVARFHYILGCSFEDLGRTEEAIAAYRAALALEPSAAKAANNLGAALEMSGRLDEAAAQYEAAARADPKLAQALVNLGNLHKRRGVAANAIPWLERAIELEPANPELRCGLAEAQVLSWELDAAVESCRAALAIDPQHERAHFGLGNALQALGRADEAEASFRAALRARPDFVEAHSNLLLCLHYRRGDEPEALGAEHAEWERRHGRSVERLPAPGRAAGPARRALRIGYLSPNFHRHSVAFFVEPLLAAHDRRAVRVFGYANVAHPDRVTARLRRLCDEWRDVSALDEEQTARMIRADGIDILVDLAGHTGGGRMRVLARKPAPVQVSWLGYPNSTGLSAMDWRLTDARADPPGEAERYTSERLLRLERGFLCYAPPEQAPEVGAPPSAGSGRVTFGSFNNLAKITPDMVARWARLLAQVPGSRMLIKAHGVANASAQQALREGFAAGGIDPGRLALSGAEKSLHDHLARYGEVDIALDTFPYNGTTTTCEAMWMGVPVVTLAGRAHVSRVGASLLHQVGLEELVAREPGDYVARAAALALDPGRLRELRAGMRARLRGSALMDAAGFARAVEEAYRAMWQAHLHEGQPAGAGSRGR
jgi:predicted O-linked N-acetylglucosamine transferase (SPINDLY family)